MPLTSGTKLRQYEIVQPIGAGAMGEVYLAQDQRLGRRVAVKILPPEMAADAERLRRFEQEARAASALNHPNIVTIYEIGEHEGTPYIAMEYVEGDTLSKILLTGPLPTDKLVRYATQMAEGLSKAHQAKIVHRDLKPANMIVNKDGTIKILDFGLAKLFAIGAKDSEAGTVTRDGTTPGTILGTVSYMAPEQAKGLDVDFRADQFSLGVIVYEMATGKRAFGRETTAETLAALLKEEPQLGGPLGAVVARCLKKDPSERWDRTESLLEALRGLPSNVSTEASIAVLPFANMSADPEQEYFCDGMAEEIINALSPIDGMRVVARTSAFAFKGKNEDVREIGKKLSVTHILEGSVRKAGTRLRITAQLTSVSDGYQLWSQRFERTMEDVFAVQDEISAAIVERLSAELKGRAPAKPTAQRRPQNLAAYDAYLRGRFHWAKGSLEGYTKSIECFEEAVAEDPGYALAYAGLSDAYSWFAFLGSKSSEDMSPKAKQAALEAIGLDGELAEAHTSFGTIKFYFDWDWDGAEREFRRALELNPDSAVSLQAYAVFLGNLGRLEDAIETIKHALELEPLWSKANQDFGLWLYIAKRYDEAIAQLTRAIEIDPDFALTHLNLGMTYTETGEYTSAIEALRRGAEMGGGSLFETGLAIGYARSGRKTDALTILRQMQELPKEHRDPVHIAWVLASLGEKASALESLEEAYAQRAPMLVTMPTFQWYDPLRDEPRFRDLFRRMNFPKWSSPDRDATG